MSSGIVPFQATSQSQAGLAEVFVGLPGNLFDMPAQNPPNIDPVPGILYTSNVSYGTDQFGNVVAMTPTAHKPPQVVATIQPSFYSGAYGPFADTFAEDVYS